MSHSHSLLIGYLKFCQFFIFYSGFSSSFEYWCAADLPLAQKWLFTKFLDPKLWNGQLDPALICHPISMCSVHPKVQNDRFLELNHICMHELNVICNYFTVFDFHWIVS